MYLVCRVWRWHANITSSNLLHTQKNPSIRRFLRFVSAYSPPPPTGRYPVSLIRPPDFRHPPTHKGMSYYGPASGIHGGRGGNYSSGHTKSHTGGGHYGALPPPGGASGGGYYGPSSGGGGGAGVGHPGYAPQYMGNANGGTTGGSSKGRGASGKGMSAYGGASGGAGMPGGGGGGGGYPWWEHVKGNNQPK